MPLIQKIVVAQLLVIYASNALYCGTTSDESMANPERSRFSNNAGCGIVSFKISHLFRGIVIRAIVCMAEGSSACSGRYHGTIVQILPKKEVFGDSFLRSTQFIFCEKKWGGSEKSVTPYFRAK